ncbi:hypothetical protein C8F04DRAFT_1228235 [Mycena alexandri]|uniref:CBM21 domain-containing protein n=1 Tax=Mycena alexandri TaxID=1745969 RepID=A0AAD6TH78_9AGAR|nr:hypothetical protein C8F04DRAFT_1228235 [Mycena alexandri]
MPPTPAAPRTAAPTPSRPTTRAPAPAPLPPSAPSPAARAPISATPPLLLRLPRPRMATPPTNDTTSSTSAATSTTTTARPRPTSLPPRVPPSAHQDDEDDGPPPPLRLRQPGPPALGLGTSFRLTPPTQYVKHAHGHRASPPRSPQRSPNASYTALDTALQAAAASNFQASGKLTVPQLVPFPRARSPSSPRSPSTRSAPPAPARTASTPVILLSNGKPLKSSLKSSSSAPHSLHHHHLRARSAPSTPSLMSPTAASSASSPTTPGRGGGEPVGRARRRGDVAGDTEGGALPRAGQSGGPARPASVSFPLEEETETETETDRDTGGVRWSGWAGSGSSSGSGGSGSRRVDHGHGYPFPKVAVGAPSPLAPPRRPTQQQRQQGRRGRGAGAGGGGEHGRVGGGAVGWGWPWGALPRCASRAAPSRVVSSSSMLALLPSCLPSCLPLLLGALDLDLVPACPSWGLDLDSGSGAGEGKIRLVLAMDNGQGAGSGAGSSGLEADVSATPPPPPPPLHLHLHPHTTPTTPTTQQQHLPTNDLHLTGTLLARNAAFEKHVYVRFTLDGWCTTSEVGGRYVGSVGCLPAADANSSLDTRDGGSGEQGREEPGPGWDRFAFSVRLTDYAGAGASANTPGNGNGNGGAGVGKGLAGRELVLVARFFAPWVRSGGVGPYVWCDSLTSTATPGTQAGTDVSPSGRAWVGTGGGGAGEWWDNNGGRDYRVGFRVVEEEVTAAMAATTTTAATAAATTAAAMAGTTIPQTPTPTNDIPFPTSSDGVAPSLSIDTTVGPPPSYLNGHPDSSPSRAPAAAAASSANANGTTNTTTNTTTTNTNTTTNPIPPPPPPRTAHAQALAAKLARLSLRNYAAPSVARTVSFPSGPGLQVLAWENTKEKEGSKEKEEKEKEGSKEKEKEGKQAPGTQSAGGVGLYWPHTWSKRATDSDDDSTEDEDEDGDAQSSIASLASFVRDPRTLLRARDDEGEGEETPPTSPLGARGALPDVDVLGASKDEHDEGSKEDSLIPRGLREAEEPASPTRVPLPASPPASGSGSPAMNSPVIPGSPSPTTSGAASPLSPSAADASSSVYKAFVRQWCFAGAGTGWEWGGECEGGGVSWGTKTTIYGRHATNETTLKTKMKLKNEK